MAIWGLLLVVTTVEEDGGIMTRVVPVKGNRMRGAVQNRL